MDPHLSAIKTWDKDYFPKTDKELYELARIEKYIFPTLDYSKTSFTKEELDNIASYPPIISYYFYNRYRKMSLKELKKEFPAIQHLVYNPKYEDYFSYATRGYISDYDSIQPQIKRWNEYNDLSDTGKNLMDLLYGNQIGYSKKFGHVLEKYILAYDHNISDDTKLRAIGYRMGLFIPEREIASEVLYLKIRDYILQNEKTDIKNKIGTEQIIQMTPKSYKEFLKTKGIKNLSDEEIYDLYYDRLSNVATY